MDIFPKRSMYQKGKPVIFASVAQVLPDQQKVRLEGAEKGLEVEFGGEPAPICKLQFHHQTI